MSVDPASVVGSKYVFNYGTTIVTDNIFEYYPTGISNFFVEKNTFRGGHEFRSHFTWI